MTYYQELLLVLAQADGHKWSVGDKGQPYGFSWHTARMMYGSKANAVLDWWGEKVAAGREAQVNGALPTG